MKLSEAIRAGAMLGPQGYGALERQRRRWFFGPRQTEYCALGGAFKIAGATTRVHRVEPGETFLPFRGATIAPVAGSETTFISHPWVDFICTEAECPRCQIRRVLHQLIAHLNDDHRMSREDIADVVSAMETMDEQRKNEASYLSHIRELASECQPSHVEEPLTP